MENEPEASGWRRVLVEPEIVFCQAILLLILVLATTQVTLRYVFTAPLSWPEELSGYLVVWLTFVGAAGVARKNLHVRVELMEEFCGPWVQRWLYPLYDLVILVFLVLLVVGGIELYGQMTFERTPAMRIPVRYFYAVVPAASAVMAVFYVWSLARFVCGLVRGEPGGR